MPGYSDAEMAMINQQLIGAYSEVERYIVERVLAADITDWQRARANQQLALIRDALRELGQTSQEWADMHIPRLYQVGLNATDEVLAGMIVPPPAAEFAALHTASIELISENLTMGLEGARQIVGRTVEDIFRQAGLAALQEGTALGETRRETSKRMLERLTDQGVTGFVDGQGNQWNMSTYAEMHIRTSSMEATNQATRNRLAEAGIDLVKVPRHDDECPKCAEALDRLGTIFSISGASDEYPAEDEARAMGLYHPNCLHRAQPYVAEYEEAV